MLKNKKILIILISIFLALVIGVSTALIIVVSTSSDNTGNSNQTENDNTETVQEFSIDINGINFLSGTSNDINITIGQEYTFNINGVNSYNDYEVDVIDYLPSSDYAFYYKVSLGAIRKMGISYNSSYAGVPDTEIIALIFQNDNFTNGFNILESNKYFTFMMEYSTMDSFLDNFFDEDVLVVNYENKPLGTELTNDLTTAPAFKLNVRKISTDEVISFILHFKK